MPQLATLHSLDENNQPDLILPLSLQQPDKEKLNLSQCPHVYENGHYELLLDLNLYDLELELYRTQQQDNLRQVAITQLRDSFVLSQEDQKRAARLDMNKISNYIELNSNEDDEDNPFTNDDDEDELEDDFNVYNDSNMSAMNLNASMGESNASGALAVQPNQVLHLPSGQFKRIIETTLEINSQPKASFTFNLDEQPGIVHGRAFFKDNAASGNNQPFLLQYDVITLCFIIKFNDNSRITLYSGFLLCANNNKEENENINRILTELTELDNDYILDMMFQNQIHISNNKNDLSNYNDHRSYKSLNSYIALIESVLNCYKNNFASFKAVAKHVITKDYTELPFDKVRNITHKSNRWLGQNLDILMPVKPSVGVVTYNQISYLPLKMQSEINKKSYNIFENRVVVGFIKSVLHNASKIYNEYKCFVNDYRSHFVINQEFAAQNELMQERNALLQLAGDPNSHELPFLDGYISNNAVSTLNSNTLTSATNTSTMSTLGNNTMNNSGYQAPILKLKYTQLGLYQNSLEKLKLVIAELNLVYLNYAKLFNIRDALLEHFPRKAKAFQEIKPYAQVFQIIMSWFRYGNFSLEKDMLFLNVKTLDKLFEYYCLYRLLDMLMQNGFKPQSNNASYSFEYALNNTYMINDPFVANTYQLVRGKQRVTVYYQPVISNSRFDNGIYAYRTTAVSRINASNKDEFNFYCPDFILKFNSGESSIGDDDYLIFDAKFSQGRNIITYYIDNLFKKYGMETSIAVFKNVNNSHKPQFTPKDVENYELYDSTKSCLNYEDDDSAYVEAWEKRAQKQSHGSYSNGTYGHRYQALADDKDPLSPRDGYMYTSAGNIISTSITQNSMSGYEFVGCKMPKMIFALQGRVNPRRTAKYKHNQNSSYSSNGSKSSFGYNKPLNNYNGPQYAYYAPDPNKTPAKESDVSTTAIPTIPSKTPSTNKKHDGHNHIWLYHNSVMARKFPPNISVGMVEMNTQVNSTPDLWREIMRNLPYLQTYQDVEH